MTTLIQKCPLDVTIAQCRQCVKPACAAACPGGALTADPAQGHAWRIDEEKCVGCSECAQACPYTPSRANVVPDARYEGED